MTSTPAEIGVDHILIERPTEKCDLLTPLAAEAGLAQMLCESRYYRRLVLRGHHQLVVYMQLTC